jgi:hypothetical protein
MPISSSSSTASRILLQAAPDDVASAQFANELAEAVNQPQLAASFLIALAEEAKPKLAGLRSRIRGFDDSSLKLTAPRALAPAVAPIAHQEAVASAALEALPVLTETVPAPGPGAGSGSIGRARINDSGTGTTEVQAAAAAAPRSQDRGRLRDDRVGAGTHRHEIDGRADSSGCIRTVRR